MTPDEMKAKLTEQLESWNKTLIAEKKQTKYHEYTTMIAYMIGRMNGMIDFACNAEIISDDEKAELHYIYFGDEV